MKVLITEMISEKGVQTLRQDPKITVDIKNNIPEQELLEIIGEYDALIVRSYTQVNEALYNRAVNLKVVGRAGNGVDNIDLDGATKRGIIIVNTPDANSVSAAELTVGMILAAARLLPQCDYRLRHDRIWSRSNLMGVELDGKTLGIVGLGRIGGLVATRMHSFGMKLIGYDPYITDARFKKYGVEKKTHLDDLMREADFITVHTPKTEETYGMIGAPQFQLAKKGVHVVNCARGGVINEEALVQAVNDGIVSGAAIDVLVDEPGTTSPLLDLCNTVVTPHVGATTHEAQDNVGITIAQEVLSALRGEMVPNAVNLPMLYGVELEDMKSYLTLGEILGKFYHQLAKDPVERVEVIYGGEIAAMEYSTVTLAVLKGLFETILQERVNFVNAQLIAQNRGVEVTETKVSTPGKYLNLIRLNIISGQHRFTVAGTVFGKDELRIIDINGYDVDVNPSDYMLVVENRDMPGMIGQIGTILGVSRINIASMQYSRNPQGNQALMVLSVDSDVPRESLKMLGGIEGIEKVSLVRL